MNINILTKIHTHLDFKNSKTDEDNYETIQEYFNLNVQFVR